MRMTKIEYQNLVVKNKLLKLKQQQGQEKEEKSRQLKKKSSLKKRENKKQKQKQIQKKQKREIEIKKRKKIRGDSHTEGSGSDEYKADNDMHNYMGSYDSIDIDIDGWKHSDRAKRNKLDRNKTTHTFSPAKRLNKYLKKGQN